MSPGPVSDQTYLKFILDTIDEMTDFLEDGLSVLRTSALVRRAVERDLHLIAESTQKLSEPIKATQAQVPWKSIAGFRNAIVHDYLGIDLGALENILRNDIGPLRDACERMLASLDIEREQ